jgi:hypothetical protein
MVKWMVKFSKEVQMANKHVKKFSTFLLHKGNLNENITHWHSIASQSEWLSSRKQTTTNAGKDAVKEATLIHC